MKLTLAELKLLRMALHEAAGWEAEIAQANRPAFRKPNAEARRTARAAEHAARQMMVLRTRVCAEISRAEKRSPQRVPGG
jgi:hypothetical protein